MQDWRKTARDVKEQSKSTERRSRRLLSTQEDPNGLNTRSFLSDNKKHSVKLFGERVNVSPRTRRAIEEGKSRGVSDKQILSDLKQSVGMKKESSSAMRRANRDVVNASDLLKTMGEKKIKAESYRIARNAAGAAGAAATVVSPPVAVPLEGAAAFAHNSQIRADDSASQTRSSIGSRLNSSRLNMKTAEDISDRFKKNPLHSGYGRGGR